MVYKKLIIIFSFFVLVSCVNNNEKEIKDVITNDNLESDMIEAYNEGLKALNLGDASYASKKFNEAELLFPQSEWAPRALLMSSYAYYLLAINYYDSIADEKKDLKSLLESKKYFEIVLEKFSDTDYSLDAKYKLDLIQDYLAAKEIYIARHYIKKKKWIPAINRLKTIVNEYNTTIYIEEALHRLVEIHYSIGLENEAKKYAKTLGYNYETSRWYEESYRIFNKDYKAIENSKKEIKKRSLTDKIKSFF